MPVRRFVEVYNGHPADELPDFVASVLTPAERAAFADVRATFARLATGCNVSSLARLLEECSTRQFVSLQLDAYDDAPLRAYFRFILRESSPAIRLPDQAADLSAFPNLLRDVYSSTGGIQGRRPARRPLAPPHEAVAGDERLTKAVRLFAALPGGNGELDDEAKPRQRLGRQDRVVTQA